jgi:hypothetical protein
VKPPPAIELVSFGDAALVVNLETGAYFQLNRTAQEICRLFLAGTDAGQLVSRLVERHGLPVLAAHRAVASVLEALEQPGSPVEPVGDLRYRESDWGYAFHRADEPVVEVRQDGLELRLCRPLDVVPEMAEGWLRSLAAKALSLQGVPVLHAAACVFGDRLIAFCGQSGAGKTTTARAFAAAGRPLHAEDMVILDLAAAPRAHVGAEAALRSWVAAATAEVLRDPTAVIACATLPSLVRTATTIPITAALFLDRARRSGTDLRAEPLLPVECLPELLQSSFLGSARPDDWRAFVAANAAVARAVPGFRLWTPDGVSALGAAVAGFDYRSISTS